MACEQAIGTRNYIAARNIRRKLIAEALQLEFNQKLQTFKLSDGSGWKLLRAVNTPPRPHTTEPLYHEDKWHEGNKSKSQAFLRHYRSVSGQGRVHKRRIRCRLKDFSPVTMTELSAALRSLRPGKAPGADGIHAEFLMHLGPRAKLWLRRIASSSLRNGRVLRSWKIGIIKPIPKVDKDITTPDGFRPVTLTRPEPASNQSQRR